SVNATLRDSESLNVAFTDLRSYPQGSTKGRVIHSLYKGLAAIPPTAQHGCMKKRGRWAEHPELLKERSREGVIKATSLESLDMSSKVIYNRCLPGGPWQRLLPGIILLHSSQPTQRERAIAALLYAGPHGMITGLEACLRYGLRVPDLHNGGSLHVLVPHTHKILSSEFVIIERTWRRPEPWIREAIPLAPPVRAVTDAVRRIRAVEPIGLLLIEAIQRGRCSPQAISRELDEGTTRGTAIPRRLLAEWADLRSVAEARAKTLARQLPVPPSHWNADVYDSLGNYIGCPDAWWDDIAMAWEIDSVDFHFYHHGYARTLKRNTRYAAAGITVVQTLPSRLQSDPAAVLAELKAAYRAAAARPRPAVVATRKAA
ncbi:hypothetical protein ACFWX6_23960, partial [Amycolatopsis sp. NPDC059019]|uniref:hypothetical protein n=1 Tax=Amycolatopsis sp. NPDC059019 TaxID=3346702 RepID=UPI0036731DAA